MRPAGVDGLGRALFHENDRYASPDRVDLPDEWDIAPASPASEATAPQPPSPRGAGVAYPALSRNLSPGRRVVAGGGGGGVPPLLSSAQQHRPLLSSAQQHRPLLPFDTQPGAAAAAPLSVLPPRDENFRLHTGYLSGADVSGSPAEMTVTAAQSFALANPQIKGFTYRNSQEAAQGRRVWVSFKPSFTFTSAPGWTAVQVLRARPTAPNAAPLSPQQQQQQSSAAAAAPSGNPRISSNARDRLVRFYQRYCPHKYGPSF